MTGTPIIAAYKQGHDMLTIAKTCGVSKSTVWRTLRKHGCLPVTDITARNARIIDAYKRGEDTASIAAEENLHRSTVCNILRKQGLQRKPPRDIEAEESILRMTRQGFPPRHIAARLDKPVKYVNSVRSKMRAKGVLPMARATTDPNRHSLKLKWNGRIRGKGHMRDVLETLTSEQLDYLLANAPKAQTIAEAVAIHLALTLPELDD